MVSGRSDLYGSEISKCRCVPIWESLEIENSYLSTRQSDPFVRSDGANASIPNDPLNDFARVLLANPIFDLFPNIHSHFAAVVRLTL